jgi:hypothetical protein
MKAIKYILFVIVAFTNLQGYSQSPIRVSLKKWYSGEGIIFPLDYKMSIKQRYCY